MKRGLAFVAALTTIGTLGWAAPSQAAVITYTMATVASGTLGGTAFTGAVVTVTLTADTAGVVEMNPVLLPGVLSNPGIATVSIEGVGSATLDSVEGWSAVFSPDVSGSPGLAMFEGFTGVSGTALIGLLHSGMAGYDFRSALGPLTGTGIGISTNPDGSPVAFSTTAGALILTSGGDRSALAVTVAAAPVPEPASLSLLAVGSLGAIAARRRRRRQTS